MVDLPSHDGFPNTEKPTTVEVIGIGLEFGRPGGVGGVGGVGEVHT